MNETGNNSVTKTAGSLSDRVRSLRLPDSYETNGGNSFWWLPWALCLVLLGATGFLALEAFSPIDDDALKKLAEERKLTVTSESAQTKLSLPGSTGSGVAASEIALESKGYIVPISLIQVSPKISGTVLNNWAAVTAAPTTKPAATAEKTIERKTDMPRQWQGNAFECRTSCAAL